MKPLRSKDYVGFDDIWVEAAPGCGYEFFGGVNVENNSEKIIRVAVLFDCSEGTT